MGPVEIPSAYTTSASMTAGSGSSNSSQPSVPASMAKDTDAKLRIGFVFRNLAAENTSFELRHNLRISAMSTISKAIDEETGVVVEGDDDFTQWDVGYDLKGRAKVSAVRQVGTFGEPHVRAVLKVM